MADPLPPLPGPESLKSWSIRLLLNRLPSYRRAGGKVVYIAPDLTLARVRVRYGWRTYGQKNSIFGGALYATIDPCYVIMLQWRLGRDYAVWDKAVTVEFRKPARSTLFADIACSDDELAVLRSDADAHGRAERVFHVELRDADGAVHVSCDKTIVVKRRSKQA